MRSRHGEPFRCAANAAYVVTIERSTQLLCTSHTLELMNAREHEQEAQEAVSLNVHDGDGTERLCRALYGRKATARDYLGGSNAKMLHDAADAIAAARDKP